MYDLLEVGAGPVGSFLAGEMAGWGLQVLVLEEDQDPGDGVCCTGIVGQECLARLSLPPNLVLHQGHALQVIPPQGEALHLEKDRPPAVVLDRPGLDLLLAQQAQARGAEYRFGVRVKDLEPQSGSVVARVERGDPAEGRAVVLACGFGSPLPSQAGLGQVRHYAWGVQSPVASGIDQVEVYLGKGLAPGFFAWLVPTRPGQALAGLLTKKNPRLALENFLSHLKALGRIASWDKASAAPIPLHPLPRSYADHLLAVGEAAGQVKPTTGGGIYYGLLAAEIAAETLKGAFSQGDFSARALAPYERGWRKRLGKEMSLGRWARRLFARLSDRQIGELVAYLRDSGLAREMLQGPDFSFDWHSRLILRALGHGGLSAFLRVAGVWPSGGPAQGQGGQE